MTENDKKLIREAQGFYYTRWSEVSTLAEKADTDEARRKLMDIQTALLREEKYADYYNR